MEKTTTRTKKEDFFLHLNLTINNLLKKEKKSRLSPKKTEHNKGEPKRECAPRAVVVEAGRKGPPKTCAFCSNHCALKM